MTSATTLREFSAAGPCITLGTIARESDSFWLVTPRNGGADRRVMKSSRRASLVHAEPCVSCRDHARTQYPDGYMD